MRGDVDGYVGGVQPVRRVGTTVYKHLVQRATGTKPIWRLVGNGRITLDTKKRLPMYQKLDRLLMTSWSRSRSSRSRSTRS